MQKTIWTYSLLLSSLAQVTPIGILTVFIAVATYSGTIAAANTVKVAPVDCEDLALGKLPSPSIYEIVPEVNLEAIDQVRDLFRMGRLMPTDVHRETINGELRKDKYFAKLSEAERNAATESLIQDPYAPIEFLLIKLKWLIEMKAKGLSPESIPRSFAEIARTHRLVSLQHLTSIKNLMSIVKNGAIRARGRRGSSSFGGGVRRAEAAYLSAKSAITQEVWIDELEPESAIIEFGPEVLDEVKWSLATPRPGHGFMRADTVERDASFEIFAILVGLNLGQGNQPNSYNEVVSDEDILPTPTSLRRIYVRLSDGQKVLNALRASKLVPPAGKSWEDVVTIQRPASPRL